MLAILPPVPTTHWKPEMANGKKAYLRKMAIDGYIIQLDYTAIKEQTAEIQKVGVNVNQIARRVNSTGLYG